MGAQGTRSQSTAFVLPFTIPHKKPGNQPTGGYRSQLGCFSRHRRRPGNPVPFLACPPVPLMSLPGRRPRPKLEFCAPQDKEEVSEQLFQDRGGRLPVPPFSPCLPRPPADRRERCVGDNQPSQPRSGNRWRYFFRQTEGTWIGRAVLPPGGLQNWP